MNFFKSKPWLTGILIGASIGLLIYWLNRDSDAVRQLKALERGPRTMREYQEFEVEKIRYEMSEAGTKRIVGDLTFEQKLALLRDKWSKHIDKGYMQIKMLEEVMNLCKKERPDDWVACTNELAVNAAFPQLGDKLFNQLSALVRYNDWLSRHKDKLEKMGRKDRQKLLNEMRGKLFGEENAKDIWANQIRVEAVRNTLDDMKEAKGKDLSTKLSALKTTLNEVFGDQAKAYVERHQQELTNAVMTAVQDDLKALTPTQQKHALRTIRSEMGMDKAALERWDALDNERQNRWATGKNYLAEREKLAANPVVILRLRSMNSDRNTLALKLRRLQQKRPKASTAIKANNELA